MPKTPIDYSKTIIYKICCKDPTITDIYVGHTTDLTKRRYSHKKSCCNPNKKYNFYVYEFIRNNGGWENWDVLMIEECNLENLQQAKIKERYWLEELKASLNKYIPSRTSQQYKEENKELINEKAKNYRQNHKEKQNNYIKQYKEENKEKLLEYSRIYYQEIKEKRKEILECEICKLCIRKDNFNRHLKSQYHNKFITSHNS